MYEASLAQLRRGSTGTARLGLREMLRHYPTSQRTPDALYFIGQSYAAENPDSAAAYYTQVVDRFAHVRPRPVGAVQSRAARRAPEGQRQGQGWYQRVVQKYPQSDEAALARDRLKALGR